MTQYHNRQKFGYSKTNALVKKRNLTKNNFFSDKTKNHQMQAEIKVMRKGSMFVFQPSIQAQWVGV